MYIFLFAKNMSFCGVGGKNDYKPKQKKEKVRKKGKKGKKEKRKRKRGKKRDYSATLLSKSHF